MDCRPFGPHRSLNVNGWRRPDPDRDMILDEECSAEGAAQCRFERFSNQASHFAGDH
jgi:hypothetical protein